MVGDFIFALSTFPIKLGLELWDKRFGFDPSYYYNPGILDTETETETTTDMSSEPPEPHTQRASPNRKPDEVKFPRKGVRKPTSDDANIHQPIASSSRTRHPLPKQDVEPNFYTTSSTSASASSTPPQQQRQKLKGRQHEVWYPPPSAYAGDDEHLQDSRTTTTVFNRARCPSHHREAKTRRRRRVATIPRFPLRLPTYTTRHLFSAR
jgi:hypothetical protein